MWTGTVQALFIASEAGAPMESVETVRAVPGLGLEGDRYYKKRGSFSRWAGSHREATLIAIEALEEMTRETGVILPAEQSRRNILTQGVPLNDLIKQTFWVGPVQMKGIRLCQPCKYLVRLTQIPGLLPGLVHRGGLRAQILTEGVIRLGDGVRPVDATPSTP